MAESNPRDQDNFSKKEEDEKTEEIDLPPAYAPSLYPTLNDQDQENKHDGWSSHHYEDDFEVIQKDSFQQDHHEQKNEKGVKANENIDKDTGSEKDQTEVRSQVEETASMSEHPEGFERHHNFKKTFKKKMKRMRDFFNPSPTRELGGDYMPQGNSTILPDMEFNPHHQQQQTHASGMYGEQTDQKTLLAVSTQDQDHAEMSEKKDRKDFEEFMEERLDTEGSTIDEKQKQDQAGATVDHENRWDFDRDEEMEVFFITVPLPDIAKNNWYVVLEIFENDLWVEAGRMENTGVLIKEVKHFGNLEASVVKLKMKKINLYQGIKYRYCVYDENDRMLFIEALYFTMPLEDLHGGGNVKPNRYLQVDTELLADSNTCYQVDGFVFPPSNEHHYGLQNMYLKYRWRVYIKLMSICERHAMPRVSQTELSKTLFMRGIYKGWLNSEIIRNGNVLRRVQFTYVDEERKLTELSSQLMRESLERYEVILKDELSPLYEKVAAYLSVVGTVYSLKPFFLAGVSREFLVLLFRSLSLENLYRDPRTWSESNIIEILRTTFPDNILRNVCNTLTQFFSSAIRSRDGAFRSAWCYPLVFIHLITNTCQPFEKLQMDGPYVKPTPDIQLGIPVSQFGLHYIKTVLDELGAYRFSCTIDPLFQQVLTQLAGPYFQSVVKENIIDHELIIKTISYRISQGEETRDLLNQFSFVLKHIPFVEFDRHFNSLLDLMKILVVVIRITPKTIEMYDTVLRCVRVCTDVVMNRQRMAADACDKKELGRDDFEEYRMKFCEAVTMFCDHFEPTLWSNVEPWFIHFGLKVFNEMISLAKRWGTTNEVLALLNPLELSLNILNDTNPRKLISINVENYCGEINVLVNNILVNIVTQFFQEYFKCDITRLVERPVLDEDINLLYKQMNGPNRQIVINCFLYEYEKYESMEEHMAYLILWEPMKYFIKFIWAERKEDEYYRHPKMKVYNTLGEFSSNLSRLEVSMRLLNVSKIRQHNLTDVILNCFDKPTASTAMSSLQQNLSLMEDYQRCKLVVRYFFSVLESESNMIVNIDEITAPLMTDDRLSFASLDIKTTNSIWQYFGVHDLSTRRKLELLYEKRLLSSQLFNRAWNLTMGERGAADLSSLENIVKNLFTPTCERLKEFLGGFIDGKAETNSIDTYVGTVFNDTFGMQSKDYQDKLLQEFWIMFKFFHLMEKDSEKKKERLMTRMAINCQCYLSAKRLSKSYKNILQIKENLKLTGDFATIQRLDSMNLFDEAKPVIDYNDQLKDDLVNVTKSEQDIMEAILNNISFFLWMRTTMKGPQEVKIFVDLVTNAAGESDFEHDRILDFESVCQAFRPIIFNVMKNSDFEEFHKACKETAIHTNPDLLKKLEDCKRNMEWFKYMKHIQGYSAHTKTFEQIKNVNRNGSYYTIGNISKSDDSFLTDETTLEEAIQLSVKAMKVQKTTRTMRLAEIEDLQSSLMLLGREARGGAENKDESENEIDFFMQHTALVIQLAKLYAELCRLGDVEYFPWQFVYECDIETYQKDGNACFGGLEHVINKLAERLKYWKAYWSTIRETYPTLNYFTVKQCLLLQRYFSDNVFLLPGTRFCYEVTNILNLAPGNAMLALMDQTASKHKAVGSNFASLESIGKSLNAAEKFDTKNRKPLPYTNVNRPSLFLLPQDEVIEFILGMYFEYTNELPNSGDVLICTKDTTIEQVKLLMLRVAYNKSGLYCLAYADRMDYVFCEELIDFMNQNMRKGNDMGNFVFICCVENENKSSLISSLETYRIRKMDKFTRTRENLLNKLCMEENIENFKNEFYAARIDHEMYNTRVISSTQGGMGKSFYVQQRKELLMELSECKRKNKGNVLERIRVQGTKVDIDEVVERLNRFHDEEDRIARLYHFDVAPTVKEGLDALFFNVVVLGVLQTPLGKVWHKGVHDMVIVEFTIVNPDVKDVGSFSNFLSMLPRRECASPTDTIQLASQSDNESRKWHNLDLLDLHPYRRVYTYLKTYDEGPEALKLLVYYNESDTTTPTDDEKISMLRVLVKKCGVLDPTWMEIRNFVYFFDHQLKDSESSNYLSMGCGDMFPGFREFVLKFLLRMAKDFSTRSLAENEEDREESGGLLLELKTRWEQSYHPYLFFNNDGGTFTFFGLNVNSSGDLIHRIGHQENIVEPGIMPQDLFNILMENLKFDNVNFATDFESLDRQTKLILLYRVLIGGTDVTFDPDPSYQLTVDNMKKILAIYTRIKCNIPVVLMGETGCGKTSLIAFMCKLLTRSNGASNMVLVKIHGGVTKEHIREHVENAKKIAVDAAGRKTILFLDEANTSDAIGLIKEIIIDKSMGGDDLDLEASNLVVVAACNPYRRHSDKMVQRLESAGLGYHVGAKQTYEKIGQIPLRQLVYRVHPLPESMKPLVWDFGQLDDNTEQLYAKEIVKNYLNKGELPKHTEFIDTLTNLLATSQKYMRSRTDECSFVSLRDVERAVRVASWFWKIYSDGIYNQEQAMLEQVLVLTLSVCYVARLEFRLEFLAYVVPRVFKGSFEMMSAQSLKDVIKKCQRDFVDDLQVKENIAKNEALCENIFMMVVCIELRIPLFIVGKPGSSKSLAKTIIQDNMQGSSSSSRLFRQFKEIFVTSYQCSPHSTAEGIIGVFKQAQNYQMGRKLEHFASVVVLDEVGLAEDSPKMPLKALHPLLEDGTDGFENLRDTGDRNRHRGKKTDEEKRVAFIGISNWALDPAKMNRGIMLRRDALDLKELISTASEICSSDPKIRKIIEHLLEPLAKAYNKLYGIQKSSQILIKHKKEEFFGMRDFYSLIKMIFCAAKFYNGIPPIHEIELAVLRNFSGLEQHDTWAIFLKELKRASIFTDKDANIELVISTLDMIRKNFEKNCLCSMRGHSSEKKCQSCRYLLIMTEKYSALPIIKGMDLDDKENLSIIFGSSFPKDQEFTQVCRDINKIKMCMETGRTVILLNMENLYESLYDALNQYYIEFGGKNYVDLGLGTHRVRCRVHEDFKLIVVADKKVVYELFPIPLINRLEKHFLTMASSMETFQIEAANKLHEWATSVAVAPQNNQSSGPEELFIGYNSDTCGSVIVQLCHRSIDRENLVEAGKQQLIKIATPDGILRTKNKNLINVYFNDQKHASLSEFLNDHLSQEKVFQYLQITTHSRLLSLKECKEVLEENAEVTMYSLVQFDTDHSFRESVKNFLDRSKRSDGKSMLFIQYNMSESTGNLVSCAQHIAEEVSLQETLGPNTFIIFVLQISRKRNHFLSGLSCSQPLWGCSHIDDLRQPTEYVPSFLKYLDMPMSRLFEEGNTKDIISIVKGSVPSALKSMSAITETNIDDLAAKIKTINQMLDENEVFLRTVLSELHETLLERESQMFVDHAKGWVMKEAVEQQHLPNYGTFRASLTLCIEDRVVPIWQSLLTLMDENDNLLTLRQRPEHMKLWVNIFKMFSQTGEHQNETIDTFKTKVYPRFPFSSRIYRKVDKLISLHLKIGTEEEQLTAIHRALQSLSISHFLEELSEKEIEDYEHDFLCYKFPGFSEKVYEVLHKYMMVGIYKQSNNISNIHAAFQSFEQSFSAQIFYFRPDLINEFLSELEQKHDRMNFDSIVLDVFINHYITTIDSMNQANLSSVHRNLRKLNIFLTQIFESKENICGLESFSSTLILTRFRVMQLFMDNILLKKIDCALQVCLQMWRQLNAALHQGMETVQSWLNMEVILTDIFQLHYPVKESLKKPCFQFIADMFAEYFFKPLSMKEKTSAIDWNVETLLPVLIRYIFHITKNVPLSQVSPIKEYAELNSPVFRGYFLHELIHRGINVEMFLESFLTENLNDIEWLNGVDVCKLFINAYQDQLAREFFPYLKPNNETELIENVRVIQKQFDLLNGYFAANFAFDRQQEGNGTSVTLEMLKMVASLRLCFDHVGNLMTERFLGRKTMGRELMKAEDELYACLVTFFNIVGKETEAHLYFLRNFLFEHGFKEMRNIVETSRLDIVLNFKQIEQSLKNDVYLVYGGKYIDVKRKILDLNQRDVRILSQKEDLYTQLALSHVLLIHEPESRMKASNCRALRGSNHFVSFIQENKIDWNIAELVDHFANILNVSTDRNALIQFFKVVALDPTKSSTWFFPTMPSDPFAVVQEFRKNTNLNFVPHACPNGHIYVITECGRAYTEAKCPEKGCGLRIGGQYHILDEKNVQVHNRDTSKPGQCLGNPMKRNKTTVPERDLSVLSTVLQRLLIHLAMLVGDAAGKKQHLNISIDNTTFTRQTDYIIGHLNHEMAVLRGLLKKSSEDTRTCIHIFLKTMADLKDTCGLGVAFHRMDTKTERDLLEKEIDKAFIKPFINNYEKDLKKFINISADVQSIYRDLYEIGVNEQCCLSQLDPITTAFFWTYRQPITMKNFLDMLARDNSAAGRSRQLSNFLEKGYVYELLKELPYIIEFQMILYKHLKFQLEKATARQKSLTDVIESLPEASREKLHMLKNSLFKVWRVLKTDLQKHGLFQRDKNFPQGDMDSTWPGSFFLCSDSGDGRYLKTLIVVMATAQNELLYSHKDLMDDNVNLEKKPCSDLKMSDVVSYRPSDDLKPLVFRNSDYSLRNGEGRFVDYNFDDIEKALLEKLCFDKCLIDTASVPMYRYRDEIRGTDRFLNLSRKIPQVPIPQQAQRRMMSEITAVDEVSDALKAVEMAIGFLSSTGGDSDLHYVDYLTDILHMDVDKYIVSRKMQDELLLCHLSSAWTMLIVERSLRTQIPFTYGTMFEEPLDFDQLSQVRGILQRLDMHVLIGLLTEYIICDLPMRGANDKTLGLGEGLDLYNEERKAYPSELIMNICDDIPMDIQLSHAIAFWNEVAVCYRQENE